MSVTLVFLSVVVIVGALGLFFAKSLLRQMKSIRQEWRKENEGGWR
jgi:hypothetical protein